MCCLEIPLYDHWMSLTHIVTLKKGQQFIIALYNQKVAS
jgi:hypothetical protein